VRELPKHTVELPDPCLEVVDPGDAEGLALGREELGELSPDEEEVSAESGDVLERSVVQVECQASQAPLAGADERALPRCASVEHELALDDRAHRRGCLRQIGAYGVAALEWCACHERGPWSLPALYGYTQDRPSGSALGGYALERE